MLENPNLQPLVTYWRVSDRKIPTVVISSDIYHKTWYVISHIKLYQVVSTIVISSYIKFITHLPYIYKHIYHTHIYIIIYIYIKLYPSSFNQLIRLTAPQSARLQRSSSDWSTPAPARIPGKIQDHMIIRYMLLYRKYMKMMYHL